MFCEKVYPRVTRETQLSLSILTLHIPVICRAYASFCRMLSRELPAKTLLSSIVWVFTYSLSITQPLQLNPTINTWYKRLNKITIKFGIELKPTKHIVVNYNFTLMIIFFLIFNKIEWVVIFILFIFLETCGEFYWVYVIVSFSFFNFIVCYY